MVSYEALLQGRAKVQEFASTRSKEELNACTKEDLVVYIGHPEVTDGNLGSLLFNENHADVVDRNHTIPIFVRAIETENDALLRVSSLYSLSPENAPVETLERTALEIFCQPGKEYVDALKKKNLLSPEEEKSSFFGAWDDASVLLHIMKKKGVEVGLQELGEKMLESGQAELGAMQGRFEKEFRDRIGEHRDLGVTTWGAVHAWYHRTLNEVQEDAKKHYVFDAKLTAQHKISPPKLLEERTLELSMEPHGLEFTFNGELFVMGTKEIADEEEQKRIWLQVYDVNNGTLLRERETEIPISFGGSAAGASSVNATLSRGSQGNFYVVGYGVSGWPSKNRGVFSATLMDLPQEEEELEQAIHVAEEENAIPWGQQIFQITEHRGTLYFVTRPNDFPNCRHNRVVAVNEDGVVGVPITELGNSFGIMKYTADTNQRIVVDDSHIYLKHHGLVAHMDKSCPEDGKLVVVSGREKKRGTVTTNQCLDERGRIYVVEQLDGEAMESIKAYHQGEFLTHVYPEDYRIGGGSNFRHMAIHKGKGLLAYSSLHGNRVHLYQLDE